MKEKFEIFKNEKIVVNVRSEKQYDDFMKLCEEQGLKWYGGGLPTKGNVYNDYEEKTCINLHNLSNLSSCDIDFYKKAGYKIITYKDFMKKSNQFTKLDLKDNHVIKARNGNKYIWFNYIRFADLINSDLTHRDYNELDVMEVWEFDKLVWKREEQILDEVEKEWLNRFIKSTKIKVKYIKKWLGASCENEYLQIAYDVFHHKYNEDRQEDLYLPLFKKGSMYKGMEIEKEYTLKELGLDK